MKTLTDFRPTHTITLRPGLNGKAYSRERVQLVDGAAYTLEEWGSSAPADWERSEDGRWYFQGRAAPYNCSVSVHKIGRGMRPFPAVNRGMVNR